MSISIAIPFVRHWYKLSLLRNIRTLVLIPVLFYLVTAAVIMCNIALIKGVAVE